MRKVSDALNRRDARRPPICSRLCSVGAVSASHANRRRVLDALSTNSHAEVEIGIRCSARHRIARHTQFYTEHNRNRSLEKKIRNKFFDGAMRIFMGICRAESLSFERVARYAHIVALPTRQQKVWIVEIHVDASRRSRKCHARADRGDSRNQKPTHTYIFLSRSNSEVMSCVGYWTWQKAHCSNLFMSASPFPFSTTRRYRSLTRSVPRPLPGVLSLPSFFTHITYSRVPLALSTSIRVRSKIRAQRIKTKK